MANLRRLITPPRVNAFDVARALAIMGMIGAHVANIPVLDARDPFSYLNVVYGNSSILFAVLAGISIALVTGRTTVPTPTELPRYRLALVGRGIVIFLIGAVMELSGVSLAVILTFYGALYIAATTVIQLRRRWLLIIALIIALAGPITIAAIGLLTLSSSGPGADLVFTGVYRATTWAPLMLLGLIIGRTPLRTWSGAVIAGIGFVSTAVSIALFLLITIFTPIDVGLDYSNPEKFDASASKAAMDSAKDGASADDSDDELVPASEVDIQGMKCYPPLPVDPTVYCAPPEYFEEDDDSGETLDPEAGWDGYWEAVADKEPATTLVSSVVSISPHSGATLEIFFSGGIAFMIIGVLLLTARPLRWALLPLSAMGAMPLTAYTLHGFSIIAVAGLMNGFVSSNAFWLGSCLVLMLLGVLWTACFGRGPLERLTARGARALAANATSSPTKSLQGTRAGSHTYAPPSARGEQAPVVPPATPGEPEPKEPPRAH